VTGRFVDEEERAVNGVEVSLPQSFEWAGRHSRRYRRPVWTVSGEHGAFVWVASETTGREGLVRFVTERPGFVPHVGPWIDCASESDLDLGTIVLHPGCGFAGEVRDDAAVPVRYVRVELRTEEVGSSAADDESPNPLTWMVTTGDDGRFVYEETHPPGMYRLRCGLPGAPSTLVRAGATDVVLVVPRACLPRKVEVDVVAVDADGRPLGHPIGAALVFEDTERSSAVSDDAHVSLCATGVGVARIEVTDHATWQEVVIENVATREEPWIARFPPAPRTIHGVLAREPGRALHAARDEPCLAPYVGRAQPCRLRP
jgi:hypothetical protein